jgi:hypothetical protein
MALILTPQTGGAFLIGLIIGANIGFVVGAWWQAVRTSQRDDRP